MAETIEQLLKETGLEGFQYEDDGDEEFPTYTVHVPRHMASEAQMKLLMQHDFHVRVKQIPPTLVPANPGQVVRIYTDYQLEDEESPIGVVTSVQQVGGRTAYGCSYIQVSLGTSHVSDVYQFHISAENYGGYHSGFLKVIEPDELPEVLTAIVEKQHKKAVDKANAMRTAALRTIPGFVEALGKGVVDTVVRWNMPEDGMPPSTNVCLPRLYVPRP